ncbi:hypothetical protein Q7P37_005559 [Cladosporium fusiforme]
MSSSEASETMPPFPSRLIKFGPFTVTSQVSKNERIEPVSLPIHHHLQNHHQPQPKQQQTTTNQTNHPTQVFHQTPHTFALVNLKPLLPGHILVCPLHPHPRLTDLSSPELTDLFSTVTRVQRTLARLYGAQAFNVAVQDGPAAGQTVPHVHVHVIPRRGGDGGEGDNVHKWLEGEEGDVGKHMREGAAEGKSGGAGGAGGGREDWPKDEERRPRSKEEMEREAGWLRGSWRGMMLLLGRVGCNG